MIIPKSPTTGLRLDTSEDYGYEPLFGNKTTQLAANSDLKITTTTNALSDRTNTFLVSSWNTSLARPLQHRRTLSLPSQQTYTTTLSKESSIPLQQQSLSFQPSSDDSSSSGSSSRSGDYKRCKFSFLPQSIIQKESLPPAPAEKILLREASEQSDGEGMETAAKSLAPKDVDDWDIEVEYNRIGGGSFDDLLSLPSFGDISVISGNDDSFFVEDDDDDSILTKEEEEEENYFVANGFEQNDESDTEIFPSTNADLNNSTSTSSQIVSLPTKTSQRRKRKRSILSAVKILCCQPSQYEEGMEMTTCLKQHEDDNEHGDNSFFGSLSRQKENDAHFDYETWSNSVKSCSGLADNHNEKVDSDDEEDKCSDFHLRKISLFQPSMFSADDEEEEDTTLPNTTMDDTIVSSGLDQDENDNKITSSYNYLFGGSGCHAMNCIIKDANNMSSSSSNNKNNDKDQDGGDDRRSIFSYSSSITNVPFMILGTSSGRASPHVLSVPLMEGIRSFFPYSKMNDNFLLKYSMIRDGASMHTFLQKARSVRYSILAIETIHGEVFGAFTSECWRKTWNSYGNGESFLWKLREPRSAISSSSLEKDCNNNGQQQHDQKESEIDVYPFTGDNDMIQICNHDKIAVGGGNTLYGTSSVGGYCPYDGSKRPVLEAHKCGYGLCIESDLRYGTSSPCVTFSSPSLSKYHSDGSLFEIRNIELWSLTPCISEEHALQLEMGMMFLNEQAQKSNQRNI